MTRGPLSDRRGATIGDVLVFLATLSVAVALLYPAWSVRDFRSRVQAAIADVEAVRTAALGVRESTTRWPTPGGEGEIPAELAGLGDVFARQSYTVRWTLWDVVDSVEAPPPDAPPLAGDAPQLEEPALLPVVRSVGAVMVHSDEEDLLAELLAYYSGSPSFVLDTTWLLVLPGRSAPPGTPGFGF